MSLGACAFFFAVLVLFPTPVFYVLWFTGNLNYKKSDLNCRVAKDWSEKLVYLVNLDSVVQVIFILVDLGVVNFFDFFLESGCCRYGGLLFKIRRGGHLSDHCGYGLGVGSGSK